MVSVSRVCLAGQKTVAQLDFLRPAAAINKRLVTYPVLIDRSKCLQYLSYVLILLCMLYYTIYRKYVHAIVYIHI